MSESVTINKEEFQGWCIDKGYLSSGGVLTVPLRSAKALFLSEDIQRHKKPNSGDFIAVAKSLWIVFREAYWTELGYDNFTMFLLSPEIDLSKSVGYSLKSLGEMLANGSIDEDQAIEIGQSKIKTLLPVIAEEDDEEIRQEWLSRAETLNNLDLMDAVAGKEISRYNKSGMLEELLNELRVEGKEVFWNEKVHLRIRTV